ncbi:MAG: hypothetical protein AABW67_05705 [Nanoarchaeota archaeon]
MEDKIEVDVEKDNIDVESYGDEENISKERKSNSESGDESSDMSF